ncbi:hypothetical protein DFH29DRAFT_880868 [Suillus ampliporus]|nr:hypothetical protein DFH29DRAFT_880868 [Suillus ampliporus]
MEPGHHQLLDLHPPKQLLRGQKKFQPSLMQTVSEDVTSSLNNIGRGKMARPTQFLPYAKPSLSQRLSVLAGRLSDALAVYVDMLDSVDRLNEKAIEQGRQVRTSSPVEETKVHAEQSCEAVEEVESRIRKDRGGSESSDEDDSSRKHHRGQLDTTKFPWHEKQVAAIATLAPNIKQTFEQLECFAVDPKVVVQDILSTPGCPPFPPEQWLNIVQWKVVDLGKVLEAAHSTDLEPKQTHVIDDWVELSFQASKSSTGIHSVSDHNIAFTKYINALTFIFLQ